MVGEAVSTMVGEAVSMSMVGEAVSMMVGEAMLMSMSMVGDAESTAVAGDEPMTLGDADEMMETIDAGESMMVGEGAGESIDPDPFIPTIGANRQGLYPTMPMLEGFRFMERMWDPANLTTIRRHRF
jgi:hypothetical protein